MEKTDVIIIGAGLTGLSLGHYLKKAGRDVIILEKSDKTGGVIETVNKDGFIYEKGPNTGVLSSAELAMLFEELKDKCTLETANEGAKKRYILKDNKWVPLPSGPLSAVATPLFSMKDKFRILGEPFRRKGTDPDESVASLVLRRLGKSYLDYAVNPFISGIYAGDPDKLVTRYALPKLYALEQTYGSFIKGGFAKSTQKKSDAEKKATREVFSAKNGLGSIIDALTDSVGLQSIRTGCSNIKINPVQGGFRVTNEAAGTEYFSRNVVTTSGSYSLQGLLPFIEEELMGRISSLRYAGVVQVSAGYTKWSGTELDAFGGLVPAAEKKKILGILFPSAIFPGRAPEQGALLSVFMGGINNMDILDKSDDEITAIVLKEINATLQSSTKPDLLKVHRYSHAIPQYERSSGERLAAIRIIENMYPGLILAGNIRDGIGMADRVKQAANVAKQITGN
ncbi:MAG TPA: protoporphyrinogen oxidase [Bacteroidales bacterium]|nr:protoporphyrinogen oxidase [Bacteroidales bacterium]